jgi:hypothetical protein
LFNGAMEIIIPAIQRGHVIKITGVIKVKAQRYSEFKLPSIAKMMVNKNPERMINRPPIRCLYKDIIKLPKGISDNANNRGDDLLKPINNTKTITATTKAKAVLYKVPLFENLFVIV